MISIIVPCYNCETTLEKCCNSILFQTREEYEIVLIDDGSKDHTPQICDKYEDEYDCVTVVHQENSGLMAAWKHGVGVAKGDYVTFIDSDDWIEETLVERLMQIIEQNHPDLILYGIRVDYDNGMHSLKKNNISNGFFTKSDIVKKILPIYFSDGTMESAAIIPSRCSKAIKKDLLINNLQFLDDSFSIGEDDLTSFAVIHDVKTLYHMGDYYPYHYYRHENSMMGNYGFSTIQEFVRVRKELRFIAQQKNYFYLDQIDYYFVDNILISIKKMIGNSAYSFRDLGKMLKEIYKIPEIFEIVKSNFSYSKNDSLKHKFFWKLFQNEHFYTLILITRAIV